MDANFIGSSLIDDVNWWLRCSGKCSNLVSKRFECLLTLHLKTAWFWVYDILSYKNSLNCRDIFKENKNDKSNIPYGMFAMGSLKWLLEAGAGQGGSGCIA